MGPPSHVLIFFYYILSQFTVLKYSVECKIFDVDRCVISQYHPCIHYTYVLLAICDLHLCFSTMLYVFCDKSGPKWFIRFFHVLHSSSSQSFNRSSAIILNVGCSLSDVNNLGRIRFPVQTLFSMMMSAVFGKEKLLGWRTILSSASK